ncbi:MAG: D-glycerate dehydrogenase [Armatimonadetes bacterium]|nr:D-glycerate dehydrogenase [Armatimonadota bacterium]
MTEWRVHVTRPIPRGGLEVLRQAGIQPTVPEQEPSPLRGELLKAVEACQGILSLLTERMDAELMERAPGLQVISNMAVGYDNVDVPEATRRGILVCNTPGVLTETCADFTWALLLSAARRVVEGDRMVRAGRFRGWGPLMLLGCEVHGSTLGVVGFGRIGRAVARRAAGFGMKVLFHSPSFAGGDTEGGRPVGLDELLGESDYVSLHTPLGSATRHLIGAEELRRMKPTAILINTSRGPVVDEEALVQALRDQEIAGAALDVYEREPEIAKGLADLPNVVLAPHLASASVATRDRMARMAAANLVQALRGEIPDHCVNPR